jgi:dsDNA-specific endonuclease/ATPase MutS2
VVGLGETIEVEVGRVRVRVPRDQIAPMGKNAGRTVKGSGVVAAAERAAVAGRDEPSPASRAEVAGSRTAEDLASARVRTSVNTCDLRGMRAEEALDAVERFLDSLTLARLSPAFILHGHGTGALKVAVRAWLPRCRYVRGWRPADADEGGDAYTVVDIG